MPENKIFCHTYVNSCRVVSDDMGDAVPLWRNESCKCVFFKIIWQEVQKENDYRDPPQAAIFLYFKRTGKNTGKYWEKKNIVAESYWLCGREVACSQIACDLSPEGNEISKQNTRVIELVTE